MSRKRIESEYLRITEKTNAIDYLERAYKFMLETEDDALAWKWVIIALHGALYGFMICALTKGSSRGHVIYVTEKDKERLISFDEALTRCQDPRWMRGFGLSKHLQLSGQQKESIRWLKDVFRNNFEHFTPKEWSIELHAITHICPDILEAIRFLAIESGNIIFLLDKSERETICSIVDEAREFLEGTKLHQGGRVVGKE